MQITEFTRKPTSKELNESLAKRFGQRVDVDSFTLDQLHDARNKLRTKLSQVESKSKFESVLNDDTYQKAKLFLDVINTAIDEKSSIQESENEAKKVGSNKETPEPYKAPAKGQCKPGYVFDIKTGMCNPDTKAIKESIIREGEEEKAQLIMAAKDMVDRITGWLEDTAEMQTESMLELGDSIRDEMGSDVSQQFIDTVKPALEAMYNTLADSREKLSGALGILTGEGAPPEQMGADAETPAEEPVGDETPAEGEDEFAASEPAAGGEEPEGRAKRESVDYRNLSLLLAGQKKKKTERFLEDTQQDLIRLLRNVIGRADSKGQSAYLSFEALNRLMQNMGGEVFDYDSFKAQYDDPKSGLKAMVDKFDGKGITLKTDTNAGGAEGDTDKGDKAVEKMAKRATAKAQGESIEEDAEDDQMKSDLLGFIGSKMQGVEQQLQNAPVNSQEEKENKEFALKMFKFLQSKLEQQKAKNPQ